MKNFTGNKLTVEFGDEKTLRENEDVFEEMAN